MVIGCVLRLELTLASCPRTQTEGSTPNERPSSDDSRRHFARGYLTTKMCGPCARLRDDEEVRAALSDATDDGGVGVIFSEAFE